MKRTIAATSLLVAAGALLFSVATIASAAEPAVGYAVPQLQIDIPGIDFETPSLIDGQLSANFLGSYVAGVYKYLIGFALTVAIVMMMVGGLQYVLGASSGDVKKGKKRMTDAIEGFVLLMFVFVILYTVNPETTLFKAMELKVIPPAPIEFEDDYVSGIEPGDLGTPTATNVSGGAKSQVSEELVDDLDAVAARLESKGYGMSITSGIRDLQKQLDLIAKNCTNPAGSDTCSPKSGRPQTCILRGMDPASCPHTTGRAIDAWGTKSGSTSQCITQDLCMDNKAACRANPCQAALITAMKAEGFCNLASEPWHFEKPKMSSTCN